jgi:lysophospholipase L1-like esterase
MLRRILTFIAVLAVPLSLIIVSALPARADESPPALSPVQGPPGTTVTASATDWSGCSSMSVSGWGTTLGTTSIDSSGAFSLPFTVPSNAPVGATQLQFSPTCSHSTILTFVTFTVTQGTPPPPPASAPAAPSNLTATAVDPNDIRLNWQDNSDNETGFEINNGVISKDAAANSTTYTWGGLAPGTYMCFKIRAYNSAGDSAWDPNVSPWYVCATTLKPAPEVEYYAAMGDSYSSGLGNPPYPYSSVCSESAEAYPALLHADVPALGKLGFIACAGAVTDDFYTTSSNLSQLASLALLPNVRTVTLTIGGNDIGFAPVVKACLNQRTDCYKAQEGAVYARLNALAGEGKATTPGGRPIHALTALLADIHREAPNAHIFLVGYPRLFGSNPRYYPKQRYLRDGTTARVCALPQTYLSQYLRYDDAQWFNQVADRLNAVLANAVAKAGVPATFVPVSSAFTAHGDCDSGQSWFTPIVTLYLLGIEIGNSALHPNQAGQRAYERRLLSAGI